MQRYKAGNLPFSRSRFNGRVILDVFIELVERFIQRIILQYIQDKPFFNGLFHGINVKGLILSFRVQMAKHLQGSGFRSGCKCKYGDIRLFPVSSDFVRNHVFRVHKFFIPAA